jgi:RNA polymerase sigma-70 factor (ECF subfamily)
MAQQARDDPELQRAVLELRAGVRIEDNSRHVFERYYPWVRRFFGRLGYSPQDSEDLAQEVLSQVFSEIGSFRKDGSFKSWLFAVASNLHRNHQRGRHREKRSGQEVSIDAPAGSATPFHEPLAAEPSPERTTFERERREAVARAIKEMPPQMGRALALRLDQDLKYREIAVVLQISVETVKAHLFSARQRLREVLGEDYADWLD